MTIKSKFCDYTVKISKIEVEILWSWKGNHCLGLPQAAISSCGCTSTLAVFSLMCSRPTRAWVILLCWWICNTAALCYHLHLGGQQHSSTQVPFSWLLIRILLHISNSSPSHVMCWELHFRPISTASCRPVCSLMHINYLLGDDWFHFSVNRTAWGVINTSIKGLFQE